MRSDLTDDQKRLTAEVTALVLERIAPDEPLGFGVDFALITRS